MKDIKKLTLALKIFEGPQFLNTRGPSDPQKFGLFQPLFALLHENCRVGLYDKDNLQSQRSFIFPTKINEWIYKYYLYDYSSIL